MVETMCNQFITHIVNKPNIFVSLCKTIFVHDGKGNLHVKKSTEINKKISNIVLLDFILVN